jgi:pimeloyl-ACP methyl ester carboxylesterase
MDTVVDYLRRLRGVERVSLIGWSLGGPRIGGYAAAHREKVDKLLFHAPNYIRTDPSDPPSVLPVPGVPMVVRNVAGFIATWDSQIRCPDQFTPAIRDALKVAILGSDPLASTWGTEGLWRAPLQSRWGWNLDSAGQVAAPALIIRGDLDLVVLETPPLNLFEDIGSNQKVYVHVACAGHQLHWENQHMILLRASEEWLRNGSFNGERSGSFAVDAQGQIRKD